MADPRDSQEVPLPPPVEPGLTMPALELGLRAGADLPFPPALERARFSFQLGDSLWEGEASRVGVWHLKTAEGVARDGLEIEPVSGMILAPPPVETERREYAPMLTPPLPPEIEGGLTPLLVVERIDPEAEAR